MQEFIDQVIHIQLAEEITDEDLILAQESLKSAEFAFETRRDWLNEPLHKALEGDDEALERFLLDTEEWLPNDGSVEEEEALRIARNLPEDSWKSPLWFEFLNILEAADDNRWNEFDARIAAVSKMLDEALANYMEVHVNEAEVTRETVLGNLLLVEGVQAWQDAIELATQIAETEDSWKEALTEAEQGSRYLVTLNLQAEESQLERAA